MITVVSAHFDDAVFSCWTILAGPGEVDVLTVYTAGPTDGRTTIWDADTGVDSATRMVQRAVENDAALAMAGRHATNLGMAEPIDYDGGPIDQGILAAQLAGAETVYVPAAIGTKQSGFSNGEHALVRDACLLARPDAVLYADNPYALFRKDVSLPASLAAGRRRVVVALEAEQRERKAAAIRCYAGELVKLERMFGPCADPARLNYEVFWPGVGEGARLLERSSAGAGRRRPLSMLRLRRSG